MTTKTEIIERLGEQAVLLPDLIVAALAANDRAKLRLTLLQAAVARAMDPGRQPQDFGEERRAAGLDDPAFDSTIAGARAEGGDRVAIPGAARLTEGLRADLQAMIDAVTAFDPAAAAPFVERLKALAPAAPIAGDILSLAQVSAMTSARRGESDSEHRLIMDLHRVINRITEQTAVETIDGARAFRLGPQDAERVKAFMRGLNRTAPLAFGHPGLGTTAARAGARLTIQNDIGATDAHVLVVHVEGLKATITYTDVHRRRAKFFMGLFEGRGVDWSPLSEQASESLGDGGFHLVTGRHEAKDAAALDSFLEHLGSRIVFLIDWNKARKALAGFVDKTAAAALLAEAARRDLGHRAFLELGGAELVLEAVRHVAAGRAPYGVRLDEVLGASGAREFLAQVLRITSESLTAGRSTRLIRDEIQADLSQRLQSAASSLLTMTLRHIGLSRMLAGEIRDALSGGALAPPAERLALAERATRLEKKGDRLTVEAREIAGRLTDVGPGLRPVIDEAEEALDALDEAAFLFSLLPEESEGIELFTALSALAEITVESAGQMARACDIAICAPNGRREDAAEALQAIDAVSAAERAADDAERRVIAVLMGAPSADARIPLVATKIADGLERATDHFAHSALALRDHMLKALLL
jgi:hypothetical protein